MTVGLNPTGAASQLGGLGQVPVGAIVPHLSSLSAAVGLNDPKCVKCSVQCLSESLAAYKQKPSQGHMTSFFNSFLFFLYSSFFYFHFLALGIELAGRAHMHSATEAHLSLKN